ncbi:MAG: AsmA-like C-terminal domain-containing protein [Deltaproteobacteria bacterium]|nr:AsmA-like C-terminal domain-containing protein [Deltaproteobacteria bacterium]
MRAYKRKLLWIIGGGGAVVILLLVLLLVLPKFVNIAPIKEKIQVKVSQAVGGEVEFQRIELLLLPRPRVEIRQGLFSIPGKIDGKWKSLKLSLKIWPLFRGQFSIANIWLESPDFKIALPEKPGKGKTPTDKQVVDVGIMGGVAPLLAYLSLRSPDLVIVIKEGTLRLSRNGQTLYTFGQLGARASSESGGMKVDLSCNSNLFERLTLRANLDPKDYRGTGQIQLERFRPHVLGETLSPRFDIRVLDSEVNLDLDFEMMSPKDLRANFQVSIPHLALWQRNQTVVIKGVDLKGGFRIQGKKTSVILSQMILEYPRLKIAGKLDVVVGSPRFKVDLEGRDVDIYSTRQAALALAGHEPFVQEIFSIVKGGELALFTLRTHGDSAEDLGELENLLIKVHLSNGAIGTELFLPSLEGDLEDAGGEITLSRGLLEATGLKARFGGTHAYNGKMRLGLEGEKAPFHLETEFEVDLSQAPTVLRKVIRNKAFLEQMDRIHRLKGKAKGRLILGESLDSIKVRVDVSEITMVAKYKGIPYPLEISGGEVSYDGEKLGVEGLNGKLGRSSFSDFSLRLYQRNGAQIEVLSGRTMILMEELFAWLSSIERVGAALKDLKRIEGIALLSDVKLKGPVLAPHKWHYSAKGEIKDLSMVSPLLPGPLTASRGLFEVNPDILKLKEVQTAVLDSSLELSAAVTGYTKGLHHIRFSCTGSVGKEALQWLSGLAHVPSRFRIRAPLSVSRAKGRWDRDGTISFSGDLGIGEGPKVSLDLRLKKKALLIDNLLIQDQDSKAFVDLELKGNKIHVVYRGTLHGSTLERIFVKNEFLRGWVKGDFQTTVLLDQPMKSAATGSLEGKDIFLPLAVIKAAPPISIENFSLAAKNKRVNVRSAALTLGDNHLTLKGSLDFSRHPLIIDMDLSSEGLKWDEVERIFPGKPKKEGKPTRGGAEKSWALPVNGLLRFNAKYFQYKEFTWRPLRVDVSFNPQHISAEVIEGDLCGVSTPGVLRITPGGLSVEFALASKNEELDASSKCLSNRDIHMTGVFDFTGKIAGQGKTDQLMNSLAGDFEMLARDGRIYRHVPLARVLAYLNVIDLFAGRVPDMSKEGFPYESITIRAKLRNGRLEMKEAIIDSVSMKMVAKGHLDLINRKMDLALLISPLKTVDAIIEKIPIIRRILEGTLVSIPVRVSGDLGDPMVIPLSPTAVGSEIVGIMKRTLKTPMTMIDPQTWVGSGRSEK